MGKFTGVLLASDFDGTIYGSVTGMPQQNVEAAKEFIAEGGIFAIATGRTYATFATHWQCILTNAPTVLSNGASVYDFHQDKLLEQRNLPATALEDLQELARQMPSLALEVYHHKEVYAHNPNEITENHMDIVKSSYTKAELAAIPTPWLKSLIQQEHEVLQEARTRLQKIRPHTYETIFSNPKYLEVTDLGVNKGTAVLNLAKSFGISQEHIYCMGDNENDLPMMAISKEFFAPASSAKVVLDKNPPLLCTCQEGALANVVEILHSRYS